MADYDSDSSDDVGDIATNVLLGYASAEATGDDFSQLGGRPTWLDGKTAPSGALAKCRVCHGIMSLLLQLNGDLPDRFSGHERRLYILGCRRKPCRRKSGSIRAIRAVRASVIEDAIKTGDDVANGTANKKPATNIGESLFGAKPSTSTQANPFTSTSANSTTANPFSSSRSTASEQSTPDFTKAGLEGKETFAQKARIPATPAQAAQVQTEPWPDDPAPYPPSFLDADKEYLEAEAGTVPSNARIDPEGGHDSAADEKALFESSLDKTFQRFADRLAQNPEQVLRYEFAGQPLLYSKSDATGKLLSSASGGKIQTVASRDSSSASNLLKVPRCASCGAARVFELQLTPHAITELEKDELNLDGMDWGTIIVAVCSQDCVESVQVEGEVGYLDEWVGVQWEEIAELPRK